MTREQKLEEALWKLLACPAIADGNHSEPAWGCKETAEAEAFARAALSAPKAEAVTVKPLEWKLSWGPYDDGDECHTAFTPFGSYSVKRIDGGWVWGFCFDEYYDEDEFSCENLADGKRSAEAHWQDRCSDIVSTTSPVPALTDEAVERAVEAIEGELGGVAATKEQALAILEYALPAAAIRALGGGDG